MVKRDAGTATPAGLQTLEYSSEVERLTVNQDVVGSIPTIPVLEQPCGGFERCMHPKKVDHDDGKIHVMHSLMGENEGFPSKNLSIGSRPIASLPRQWFIWLNPLPPTGG